VILTFAEVPAEEGMRMLESDHKPRRMRLYFRAVTEARHSDSKLDRLTGTGDFR